MTMYGVSATPAERARPLPGDGIVPDADVVMDRGIDVVSWTGEPNVVGTPAPVGEHSRADVGLVGTSLVLLGGAALYRRRRLRHEAM